MEWGGREGGREEEKEEKKEGRKGRERILIQHHSCNCCSLVDRQPLASYAILISIYLVCPNSVGVVSLTSLFLFLDWKFSWGHTVCVLSQCLQDCTLPGTQFCWKELRKRKPASQFC